MAEPYYASFSLWRCFFSHIIAGLIVFSVTLTLCTTALYAWGTTVNTCQSRSRYSVLTFIEEVVPVVAIPIRTMICP